MTPSLREQVAALVGREVSVEELRAAIRTPIAPSEREELLSLVRWFTRRYPTAAERLANMRASYRRWTARAPR